MNAPVRIPGQPAPIGDNAGPVEPTPFDLSAQEIGDLYEEARNFLDGEPIQTQAMAEAVGKLMASIRDAAKVADQRREAENKPFNEGKAEVQARYNTLIGETKTVTGKAVLALNACDKALAPFLAAREAEKRRVEAEAREAARVAEEAARAAFQASRVDDLAAREEAERLAATARDAEAAARRAEKDRATVKGTGRAIGVRKTYAAEVVDTQAFARWVWANRQDALTGWLKSLADQLCSQGVRDMPGVKITEGVRAQ
ncbi:hypothetical protein ASG40_11510 [Methylobacterium sp. Leaf399]|uniref:hypothetical protein n=1 Tax=Methylobacterium sp. Leaf399 TaxID=1736364 RepID=UPI0006F78154|nr:hypothetical protein [Methylobacterium sp. Leaf399]KQT08501.1 hypothetical protein ASG40_11510 [Methylobacterium sp. Leaf399]